MLEIPASQIGAWVGHYLWPLFRIGAFLMVVPVIGTRLVPMRVRIGLTLLLTLIVAPMLPPMPPVDALSLRIYLLIGEQLLIGFGMAFVLQLLFQIFVVAGQIIAMQMGLGFASMVDPVNGISVAVLSQFYLMLVMLLFVAMNGHLVMIEVMVESFRILPVTASGFESGMFWQLVSYGSWMFGSALVIALPAVTALLVVHFAFGVMNRAAPQFNVFSLGFPFSLLFGLVIVLVSLSGFLPQFTGLSEQSLILLREWTGG